MMTVRSIEIHVGVVACFCLLYHVDVSSSQPVNQVPATATSIAALKARVSLAGIMCPYAMSPTKAASGSPIVCVRVSVNETWLTVTRGDCPTGNYCFEHDDTPDPKCQPAVYKCHFIPGAGHCCPTPLLFCPANAGPPLLSHWCGPLPAPNLRTCPSESHYCYQMTDSSPNSGQVCCPKTACTMAGNITGPDGKCYGISEVGERCVISEQCQGGSTCQNGICACAQGMLALLKRCMIYCSGDPASMTPLTDSRGNLVSCKNSLECPGTSTNYCHSDFKVCCPIPAPKCPGSSTALATASLKTCDVANPSCASGSTCQFWFTHWNAFYNNIRNVPYEYARGLRVDQGICC